MSERIRTPMTMMTILIIPALDLVETDIWKAVLDVAGIKSLGADLNHLATDESPLHDIFSTTMRPTIRGHIIRWIVAHMPFREWLPMESCSEFVRKCARARIFLGEHVRRARLAFQRGEKTSSTEDVSVLHAMVEHEGVWDDSEILEYVSLMFPSCEECIADPKLWQILNFIVLGKPPQLRKQLAMTGRRSANVVKSIGAKLTFLTRPRHYGLHASLGD